MIKFFKKLRKKMIDRKESLGEQSKRSWNWKYVNIFTIFMFSFVFRQVDMNKKIPIEDRCYKYVKYISDYEKRYYNFQKMNIKYGTC